MHDVVVDFDPHADLNAALFETQPEFLAIVPIQSAPIRPGARITCPAE